MNWIGHIPSTTYSLSSPAKTGHSEFTGCGMILIIGVPMGTEYLMALALFDLRASRSERKHSRQRPCVLFYDGHPL